MKAYDNLSTFPDVAPTLQALSQEHSIDAVVFSNGTHDMVSASVHQSPDLGPHASVFSKIVTVEAVRRFKPDTEVYFHLAREMGLAADEAGMGKMWLVSGNPFDIVGARAVGMNAVWVDRGGAGWTDCLLGGAGKGPTAIVQSLEEVVSIVSRHSH